MALKSFNVAKGLSVGSITTDVIDQNANITAAGLSANGNVSFTGNVTLTGANVSLGSIANLHITGGSNGQALVTDGNGNISFATPAAQYGDSDVITLLNSGNLANIRADYFYGDGGSLTNINGSNVSEVANSNYATFAGTAYSVDGANVSGEVGSANFATYSSQADSAAALNTDISSITITGGTSGYVLTTDGAGTVTWSDVSQAANANYANYAGTAYSVDGANVSGTVGSASVAYSVDGANVSGTVGSANIAYSVDGANVSGEVANANYATFAGTAYSVDWANITNIGEIANANYATFAGTAYSVDGSNVSGTVANAQYADSAGSADTADYVVQGAQANITSVGTLTGLEVDGSANISGTVTITTGGANITGDVGINGNLTITGNLVYLDVENTTVSDPLLMVAANNSADLVDIGIVGEFDGDTYTGVARDHTDGTWKFFETTSAPTTTVNFTNLANIAARDATLTGNVQVDENLNATGYISANAGLSSQTGISTGGFIEIKTSTILAADGYTTSTSQTSLGKFGAGAGQAYNFLIRGSDLNAPKYSTASAMVLTDAQGNVDYAIYGALDMGGGAGTFTFAAADGGANVEVFVTATSSNNTWWSTQVRAV